MCNYACHAKFGTDHRGLASMTRVRAANRPRRQLHCESALAPEQDLHYSSVWTPLPHWSCGPIDIYCVASDDEGGDYRGTGRVVVYFLALGLGFLFVEIPLAQRFILLIGRPVTALTVVLFALLLFSGLGSVLSPRISLRHGLLALVGLILVYPPLMDGLMQGVLGASLTVRVLAAIFVLAPLGLAMGVP